MKFLTLIQKIFKEPNTEQDAMWKLRLDPRTKIVLMNLTLYAPCVILQYVYKATRCSEFL